jgi:voltage-gated potassium channel
MKPVRREMRRLRLALSNPLFIYLVIAANSILLIGSVAFFYVERDFNPLISNFLDSLWWGVATITTVGYGDIVPVTFHGKVIGFLLMYFGTFLFVVFTSLVVAIWMRTEVKREMYPLAKKMRAVKRDMVPIERGIAKEEREQRHILQILEQIKLRLDKLERK